MPATSAALKITRLRSPARLKAAAALMAASDPWRRLGIDEERCLGALRGPFRETYAAHSGGRFAGLAAVAMYGTFKGYIQALFVAEGFRGRGVGERLLAAAEKRIFRESPNVFLCVSSFNSGARRFYRRLGYAEIGLLRNLVREGLHEVLLRKTKGPLGGRKGKNG